MKQHSVNASIHSHYLLYTSSVHTARKSEYKGNPPSQEDNIKAAQNKNQKTKRIN